MQTPSEAYIAAGAATSEVTDGAGRVLTIRQQTTLDRLRLFKAVGPELAENERYLGLAGLAFAVLAIDGVPFPQPANEQQVEAAISRIGDSGMEAIGRALTAPAEAADANPGN